VLVNIVREVVNQITRFGEVRRGRFDVDIEDLTPDSAANLNTPTTAGAIISNVQADSPAEKAGLRRGDVVLGFNGRPVKSGPAFRNRLALTPIDEEIELSVWRDGQQQSMRGRIAAPALNTIIEGQAVAQLAGLKIANLERGSPQFRTHRRRAGGGGGKRECCGELRSARHRARLYNDGGARRLRPDIHAALVL
jgi:serine protease Do/serine protease DegQ